MLSTHNEKNIINAFDGLSIIKKSSIDEACFFQPTIIKKNTRIEKQVIIKREKMFQTHVDITPMQYQKPYNKTKPCNNAMNGYCSRKNCSFAHSINQLNPVQCSFGDSCYRKNNQYKICTFIHSETISEWISRTGLNVLGLPEMIEQVVPEIIMSDLTKTKACTTINCSNSRCSFAHSLCELRDPVCSFGITCNKKSCKFKHPNEDATQYRSRICFVSPFIKEIDFISNEVPSLRSVLSSDEISNTQHVHESLIKTKACNNVKNCIMYDLECTFAHSLSELRDPVCIQGENCRKQKCDFKHPNEDSTQYRERINFIDPFEEQVFNIFLPDGCKIIV